MSLSTTLPFSTSGTDPPSADNVTADFARDAQQTVERHGRAYHAHSQLAYPLPKDSPELDRLQLQHEVMRTAVGSLHLSPLPAGPHRALDVGTAQACWPIDLATRYPDCTVTGLDIVPLPDTIQLPANCQFQIGNLQQGLPFPDDTFDLARGCLLLWSMPGSYWPTYLRDLWRVTQPGGWLELWEVANRLMADGTPTVEMEQLRAAYQSVSQQQCKSDSQLGAQLDRLLTDLPLQQLRVHACRVPLGSWASLLGQKAWQNHRMFATAIAPAIAEHSDISQAEVHRLLDTVEQQLNEHHAYYYIYCYFAQKPE